MLVESHGMLSGTWPVGKATPIYADCTRGHLSDTAFGATCVCTCWRRTPVHAILVRLCAGTFCVSQCGLCMLWFGSGSFAFGTCTCHMGRGSAVWGGCGASPLTCSGAVGSVARWRAISSLQSRTWGTTPGGQAADSPTWLRDGALARLYWRGWGFMHLRLLKCCCGCGGVGDRLFHRQILHQNRGAEVY